jgi:hypothetical protein
MVQVEYIKITPTREVPDPQNVVRNVASLRGHDDAEVNPGLIKRLRERIIGGTIMLPKFTFIMLTQGEHDGISFLYSTDDAWMDTLEHTLERLHPQSYDVERVEMDPWETIVMPQEFQPANFLGEAASHALTVNPDESAQQNTAQTPTQHGAGHTHTDTTPSSQNGLQQVSPNQYNAGSAALTDRQTQPTVTNAPDTGAPAHQSAPHQTPAQPTQGAHPQYASEQTPSTHTSAEGGGQPQGQGLAPSDLPDILQPLNDNYLRQINPPTTLSPDEPVTSISGPTLTEDGTILARPTLSEIEPVAVRWNGHGERKRDWMTTLPFYENVMSEVAEEVSAGQSPLAPLIDFMATASFPLAFQVVFHRKQKWTKQARDRKYDVHTRRDTRGQKITEAIADFIHSGSRERRREKRRKPIDDVGETVGRDELPSAGEATDRQTLIDLKQPTRTFSVNVRAVAAPPTTARADAIEQELRGFASQLSSLDGYYYSLKPEILRDTNTGWFESVPPATAELRDYFKWRVRTGVGRTRPDITMNAQELANLCTVPSKQALTTEGGRGSRSEPETRDPLPRPHAELMEPFHCDGMDIGYACDKRDTPEEVPTSIPPRLLDTHYARFGSTGSGKSISIINDMLSLHDNTSGPTILIDPKGDGMAQNYMRAHFQRFGEDDLRENVLHFNVPEVLPGFSFFDIRPELEDGVRRVDAVQHKADHYDNILQFVMDAEDYNASKVAPIIISSMIKALFDAQYGDQQYEGTPLEGSYDRDSCNYFSHDDLEHAMEQLQQYVLHSDDPDSDLGCLPEVSDDRLERTLSRHVDSDRRDFTTIIDAVFNRLDYIRSDTHLRRIFDNTERQFDFRDHLEDDTVILFDLGDLRPDAAEIMTGVILTNLWDAVNSHDQQTCTRGHDSKQACAEYAKQQNRDPSRPPCREPLPEDHLTNLIIDEASSVAISDMLSRLLEKGRSFSLSVGLASQSPSQIREEANENAYKNLFNNIGTMLFSQLSLQPDVAEFLSHESIDSTEFQNRVSNLPEGEWIGQLPSPAFGRTGPEPMTLKPLEPPSGHPASEFALDEDTKQYLTQLITGPITEQTQAAYGVPRESYETSTDDSKPPRVNATTETSANTQKERTDTQTVAPTDTHTEQTEQEQGDYRPPAEPSQTQTSTPTGETTTDKTTTSKPPAGEATTDKPTTDTAGSLPKRVWKNKSGFLCSECNTTYGKAERAAAIACCGSVDSYTDTTPQSEHSDTQTDNTATQQASTTDTASQTDPTDTEGADTSTSDSHSQSEQTTHAATPTPSEGERGDDTATTDRRSRQPQETPQAEAVRGRNSERTVTERPTETNFVPDDGTRPSVTASQTPVPAHRGTCSDYPVQQVLRSVELPPSTYEQYEISKPALDFMSTVLAVMNNTTPLPRYASLTPVREFFIRERDLKKPEIQHLRDGGWLVEHDFARGVSYTVTPAGREFLGPEQHVTAGRGIGDRGDGMPHRVGADLAIEWLARNPEVTEIRSFMGIEEDIDGVCDVAGYTRVADDTKKLHTIVEVEGGRTQAERDDTNASSSPFGHDYDSLVTDYENLAAVIESESSTDDAQAVWVVRNREHVKHVLTALETRDKLTGVDSLRSACNAGFSRLNKKLAQRQFPGLDRILSYRGLRRELKSH